MRSIISSIWREECLAGGAHSQVCRLEPALMRCGERRAPPHHQTRLDGPVNPPRELRLMLAPSGRDHRAQQPLVDNEEPVLIEPAARKSEQPLAVVRAGKFLAQHPHEGTPVMASEPLKSKRIAGELLMFDQGRGTPVHRAQRSQVRGGNAESLTQVPPQQRRHHPHRIEEPAAHAQKPNLQGKTQA